MTLDREVRPRTRPGRLAALDRWLVHEAASLLDGRGAIVDFGFGESPVTTLELAAAVRARTPTLRVVGIERRVHLPVDGLALVAGGFEACAAIAPAAVVRALNVLRAYREDELEPARSMLGAGLVEGGLLVEGSTDTEGHVTCAWLLRKRGGGVVREALLFHTDFSRGFSPWLFRDWLPRDLRRSVRPGTPIHLLLSDWEQRARAGGETGAQARFLSSLAPPLVSTDWEREHGFVRWEPSGGE
ncbi:MAG: methylase [Myxococcota bacterium]